MSHITNMRLRVKDLDALEEAGGECGLELRRGQRSFKWYGRFVGDTRPNMDVKDFGKCEHALRLKDHKQGDYEIGVVKALDGGEGYDLVMDTFCQQRLLAAAGGEKLTKLRQHYAASVTIARARKALASKGFVPQKRELLANGRMRVALVQR